MIRNAFGWLRAWLREWWDWAGSIAAFGCLVAYLQTYWIPFLPAAGVLSLTALCSPQGCLHDMWLRLPPVKWYVHRRWVRHARWIAARQKAGFGAFCWGQALSGIDDREAVAEFWRDIQRLHAELGPAATPDETKEQSGE